MFVLLFLATTLVSQVFAQSEQTTAISKDTLNKRATVNSDEEFFGDYNHPVLPLFNGKLVEEGGFKEYVNSNLIYPKEAKKNGITGNVLVEFSIDVDGSLVDAKVIRSVHPLLDAEALRVIQSSPKWTPGTMRGNPVKVKYTFPVRFKL